MEVDPAKKITPIPHSVNSTPSFTELTAEMAADSNAAGEGALLSPAGPLSKERVPFFEKVADRLGICLSALCVVHCLLTPVILLLLPSVQFFRFFTTHETFHQLMLIVLPLLALLAFIPGFRLHGDKRVFLWAIPGIASIAAGALLFESSAWLEAGFSITGSCMLIRAHLLNRVLCSCCETGHGRFAFGSSGGASGEFKRFRTTKTLRKARLLSAPRKK